MLAKPHRKQKGFTLIELIIALAIASAIGAATAMTAGNLISIPSMSNESNTSINQVRNAVHWISRDAMMAHNVTTNYTQDDPIFLVLTREDYDDSELHIITYILESTSDGLNRLNRSYTDNTGTTHMTIAQYIEPKAAGITESSWDTSNSRLTITISAMVGSKKETRTFEVNPRPID